MRVLVIGDMEGVAGISRWEQVTGGDPMYQEGRKLYTAEMNAAVRGAYDAGATEVVVMDCHGAGGGWSFNSLIPEDLDERCEFVVQTRWTEYTTFLEEGCDAAVFVAMHARAGAEDGVLNHTVRGTHWRNLWFNGHLVGESAINAALCGTWNCPVVFVSGDEAACAEARTLLGEGLETVAVKTGLGRFSARHLAPARARRLIQEGVARALSDPGRVAPYKLDSPVTLEVELTTSDQVDDFRQRAGVEVTDTRRVVSRADDWWTAWKQLYL